MNTPITVQYKINASAENIWKALTDKSEMKSWYFTIRDFELEPGKEFDFYESCDGGKYLHRGRIVEIIPNRKLKHTWAYPELSNAVTTVTWDLQQEEDGTLVTLTHENIEGFDGLGETFSRANFTEGWNSIIGQSMKEYVEK
ncbi:SRPBCC domain-containing protein [Chryseobacterium sp. RP-3-3]|uniref:SRPBCC domain-containing protein n=1 Tax=Chryseobacterium antibioticum TaxID=2728847 RepID=A0A7Y0AQU9_9FLAO|nr:SRPBCC domain-containing protein [Chryseobacterium antibioticum]NML71830.1 SRPBCC domain-containing protein [Chryseobacterium antibioticum]